MLDMVYLSYYCSLDIRKLHRQFLPIYAKRSRLHNTNAESDIRLGAWHLHRWPPLEDMNIFPSFLVYSLHVHTEFYVKAS